MTIQVYRYNSVILCVKMQEGSRDKVRQVIIDRVFDDDDTFIDKLRANPEARFVAQCGRDRGLMMCTHVLWEGRSPSVRRSERWVVGRLKAPPLLPQNGQPSPFSAHFTGARVIRSGRRRWCCVCS